MYVHALRSGLLDLSRCDKENFFVGEEFRGRTSIARLIRRAESPRNKDPYVISNR